MGNEESRAHVISDSRTTANTLGVAPQRCPYPLCKGKGTKKERKHLRKTP